MEVLVTFLNGNLDRPLITGCVYNDEHPLPYALPEHKNRSRIKTSSTPGGDDSNKLRFENAAGREQLYLHAQRDLDAVVENNRNNIVHDHETRTVDRNRSRTVRGHEAVAIDRSQRVSVENDHLRTVKGNEVVTIHKNLVMHIVGRQVIQVDERDSEKASEGETPNEAPPVEAAAADEAGGTVNSTRIPSASMLASMIAMPRMAEAMAALAAKPRIQEALTALAGQAQLIKIISTVASEGHVAPALAVLGGKTTAALLLRANTLGRGQVDAAKLVGELRPETTEIPADLIADMAEAARKASGGGGVDRGGGAGNNAFTHDPKDLKRSLMTILGRGKIDSPDGFKITAGASFIEVTAAGITIKGPLVTIDGHPIKLNCWSGRGTVKRADPPGFSLRLERDDYDVVGSTLSQLRACSALLGPSPDGRPHAAYTRWKIRWRYKHRLSEGRWSAITIQIATVVTRTLPRWSPVRSAEPSLAVEWARYLDALTLHEQGHLLIAAEGGRAVHEALVALAPCATREALDALAGETARAITARHRDEERAYDALTDHGATQGCV